MAPTKQPLTPSSAHRHRRRRRCLIITLSVLLALALLLLVLFLTVLRVRDPTIRLVSTSLAGVTPRFALLPVPSFHLNVTLLLTVSVHNPNPASFAYADGGHADLSYRGAHVGDAQIGPGDVSSRGDAEARLALTLQADRFLAADDGNGARQLAEDVQGGALPLDAATRVPGTVVLFGLFRRRAVAYSECRLVLAVAEMRVQSHECSGHTKL